MPGLYGNVGNTTVSGGNTTGLYNTGTAVTISNNINCNDINASGNLFVAGTGTFGGNVTAPNFNGNVVGGNISGVNLDLTGNAEIDGNLTVAGTIFGTFSGNITGNIVVPGANTNVLFNNSGNAGSSNDFTFNDATNVMTVNGTANVGVLNATGNVTGNYIFGNGSQLTGLPATYSDANVTALLAAFGSNTIATTGNITAGYFLGNGSQLTGIVSSYGNANVAAYLPTYTGNIAAGNLTAATTGTGNLQVDGNIALTKTPEARILASEDLRISAASAQDLYLSNPSIGMANIWLDAQDIRLARTFGGSDTNVIVTGQITTTGNVTGANIIGNGQYLTNLPGANVTGTVANATSATHAVTANTVTDAAQGNITSVGTLTGLTVGGDQNITGNLVVGQNLTVNGNTIQVNITELNVQDPIIGLGRGENNAPLTSNDGKDRGEQLWYYAGTEKSAFTGYDNSAGNLILATDVAIANEIVSVNAWGTTETGALYAHGNITGDYVFGNAAFMTGIPAQYGDSNVTTLLAAFGSNAISTTGNVTAGYFFGDGSGLTNINAGNIVGAYGNANVANFLANYGSNTIVTTGNISGGNVIGTFLYGDGSNITGVVAGAASTRIEVKNTSGVTITKGTPVYATGTVGASTIIEIAASRADTASTMPCLGLLAQDLNNNDQGYAISVGTLTSTNTNSFTTGQELYVAATGGLTASRPTGTNIVQTVGIVGRVDSVNGSIEVNVWNVNGLPNLGNGNVWIGNANGFPTQQVAYGDANVAAYLPTYTGNLAGGNITVTGVYYGNGSGLTSLTGANVTGTVANATYATSAGSAGTATTAVTVTGNAQANITSVGTLTTLIVSGNIGTGGILTDGYYYANGAPVSFGGTYGNANVSNFLANGFGSNTITTSGNVQTGNLFVTGTISNPTGNVIVSDTSLDVNGRITGNVSVGAPALTLTNQDPSGSGLAITAGNANYGGGAFDVVTVDSLESNRLFTVGAAGNISTRGNIRAGAVTYTATDGSAGQVLTTYGNGITYFSTVSGGSYGNANVADFLANGFGSNTITTTGNIQAGNLKLGNSSKIDIGSVTLFNNSVSPASLNINGSLEINDATIFNGDLKIQDGNGVNFYDSDNTNYVGLKGPGVVASDVEWTLPAADGTSAQALSTYGNGQLYWQTVGSGGSYGDANVVTLLGSFGSNTIVTTGNITGGNLIATSNVNANIVNATTSVIVSGSAGNITGANYVVANYFSGNGSQLTGINSFSTIDANGTSIVADSISDTLTLVAGSGVTITGNATTDSITISASGGGGSPGGSDTQIQFNDGGSFGGNAQMTFSKTTGNVAFGNLIIKSTNPNSAAVITNVNTLNPSARPLLGRVAIGAGFDGDWGNTGDYMNATRNSAVAVMNRFVQTSTSNTTPMIGQGIATWFDNAAGGTVTSAGNVRGVEIDTYYTGSRWGNQGSPGASVYNGALIRAVMGNGSTGGSVGLVSALQAAIGSNSTNATINDNIGVLVNNFAAQSGANHGNVSGVSWNMNSSNPTVGNVYLLHNQVSGSSTHGANWGMGGNYRSASRYYFIRNDDDVSQVKLGSLRLYHEYQNDITSSSGALTVNKGNGQVKQITLTENITTVTFSNFVTTASDGVNTDYQTDTVTMIVRNGATPYSITFPTGAGYKYSGGVNTTDATANSVTMVAITAYYNTDTSANEYLITISPVFEQV